MTGIDSLALRLVYDSRGQETIEATITADRGRALGRATAPSGASVGAHEVRAFPPGGVAQALAESGRIAAGLVGRSIEDQAGVDATLHAIDGTPEFARIGGNTATAVSLASAIARAGVAGVSLAESVRRPGVAPGRFPAIVGNCLNGGRHAIGGPEFQEFIAFSPESRPDDSVRAALAVHRAVGLALQKRWPDAALGRGDEGGWVAPLGSAAALELLAEACRAVADDLHLDVRPGLDVAASELFRDGRYRYRDRALDLDGQIAFLAELVDRHHLAYLEDPLDEEEFDGFARLRREVGDRVLVVGDDLYTTRADRLERGIRSGSTNSVLVKVNQVGTLTDTLATVDRARSNGLGTVASHRSGDVPEGWLAHLAVGFGSAGLKCGLLGGERVAKLNELRRLAAAQETR